MLHESLILCYLEFPGYSATLFLAIQMSSFLPDARTDNMKSYSFPGLRCRLLWKKGFNPRGNWVFCRRCSAVSCRALVFCSHPLFQGFSCCFLPSFGWRSLFFSLVFIVFFLRHLHLFLFICQKREEMRFCRKQKSIWDGIWHFIFLIVPHLEGKVTSIFQNHKNLSFEQ